MLQKFKIRCVSLKRTSSFSVEMASIVSNYTTIDADNMFLPQTKYLVADLVMAYYQSCMQNKIVFKHISFNKTDLSTRSFYL